MVLENAMMNGYRSLQNSISQLENKIEYTKKENKDTTELEAKLKSLKDFSVGLLAKERWD